MIEKDYFSRVLEETFRNINTPAQMEIMMQKALL